MIVKYILAIGISYVIGSIPTAYIFGRVLKNIDIRQHGSGNIGATNTFRVLGKGPGIIVLLLDILKGVWASALVPGFVGWEGTIALIVCGICSIIGHNWTIFLKFKGGKGVATSLGVLIGITIKIASIRVVLFLALLIWGVTFLISGFVSLASILAAIALPFLMALTTQPIEITILGIIFCLFTVLRHKPNIQRLLEGTESRVKTPFNKPS